MLKLHFKDNQQPPFLVTEKTYSIGSGPDNHLVINDPSVDKLHARLIIEDDKCLLKDNHSSAGSFINGQRVTNKEIFPGDMLKFGTVEIIALDPRRLNEQEAEQGSAPWRLISDSSWLPGKIFIVPTERPITIGRTEQCDITIPGTHLSRRHAELSLQGSQLLIKDLGSANGTFLNDKQITEAYAKNGDKLRIDVYNFRIAAPIMDDNKTRVRASDRPLAQVTPPERKAVSSEPKRWKTKPTSPGNRIEPTTQTPGVLAPWKWLLFGILLLLLALLGGKYL